MHHSWPETCPKSRDTIGLWHIFVLQTRIVVSISAKALDNLTSFFRCTSQHRLPSDNGKYQMDMSVMKVDVSIVIVSWNSRDVLRNCLRSILDQTSEISFEIFVVDNASQDGSALMVRSEFPNVKLLANNENRGFAAANNQAIRVASGRYVLLLNPDTIILNAAISRCVHYADAHADIGAVGCQVLENDNHIQRTGFSFPNPWNLFLVEFWSLPCFSSFSTIWQTTTWMVGSRYRERSRCHFRNVSFGSG